jgi:hypothetical protein
VGFDERGRLLIFLLRVELPEVLAHFGIAGELLGPALLCGRAGAESQPRQEEDEDGEDQDELLDHCLLPIPSLFTPEPGGG